jgi:alanyl aminopeptidase
LAIVGAACATFPEAAEGPGRALRLTREVRPIQYVLDLTVDPAQERFSGTSIITLALERPTQHLRLHGRDLEITAVRARTGDREVPGRATPGPDGELNVEFAEPLSGNNTNVQLSWTAPLRETLVGLYRARQGDAWYAMTQFEPLEARRAFPCFDQPDFKAPFAITLRVPAGLTALSNYPELSRRSEAGLEVVTFQETAPLPTYLVAVAVGPWALVDGSPIDGLPHRVVSPAGKGAATAWALERTPPIVRALTGYFGTAFPFPKLDQIALPALGSGAMENAGLVTYREQLLLLDAQVATREELTWAEVTLSHELAHMWFGDQVTMAWWDEVWLNEAFATWLSQKLVDQGRPELEVGLVATSQRGYAMKMDAMAQARAIRQPIRSAGDVYGAFDALTYAKGASVLAMVEAWLGPDVFQRGVREYLRAHAGGNATTEDLLVALQAAAGGAPVRRVVSSFVDQPGTPRIQVDLVCPATAGPARVRLTQERELPTGSHAAPDGLWTVPVCMRYGDPVRRQCVVMERPAMEVALEGAGCPQWLQPNDEANGHYRWTLPPALLGPLLPQLSSRERMAMVADLSAWLEADAIEAATYLAMLEKLAATESAWLLNEVLDRVDAMARAAVSAGVSEGYGRWVSGLVLPEISRAAELPAGPVKRQLMKRATRALYQHTGLAPSLVETAALLLERAEPRIEDLELLLPVAAQAGDEVLWTALRRALDRKPEPTLRTLLLGSLGSFEDPALHRRSLDLVLDGTVGYQDLRYLLPPARQKEVTQDLAWRWITENRAKLLAALGDKYAAYLPQYASGFCTSEGRDRFRQSFDGLLDDPGLERTVANTVEGIDRCIRQKARLVAGLPGFLEGASRERVGH